RMPDTVDRATPQARATSAMVGRRGLAIRRGRLVCRFAGMAAPRTRSGRFGPGAVEEASAVQPAMLGAVVHADGDRVAARLDHRRHIEFEVVAGAPPGLVRLMAGVLAVDPPPALVDDAGAAEHDAPAGKPLGHVERR